MSKQNTAKFTFLYLLSLIALVFLTTSLGMGVFQIINQTVKEVGEPFSSQYSLSALRFAIAAILVSMPIYLVTVWQINRSLFQGLLSAEAGVRRWLTYLILLIAAVVMIGYLIGIINSFLEGELTLKFTLKVLAALVIAGVTFSYYLYDIRRTGVEGKHYTAPKIYLYVTVAAGLMVIVGGLAVSESPFTSRQRRQDQQVVGNLSMVAVAIDNYYAREEKMPSNLDELVAGSVGLDEKGVLNPVTGEKFEYRLIGNKEYELCADFQLPTSEEEDRYYVLNEWRHGAGRDCFQREARDGEGLKVVPMVR